MTSKIKVINRITKTNNALAEQKKQTLLHAVKNFMKANFSNLKSHAEVFNVFSQTLNYLIDYQTEEQRILFCNKWS